MEFDIRQIDLGKLNSMTKYPSILTYHKLGDKGILLPEVQIPFTGRIIGTEKVDGTNARMIFCPDESVLVGSREDLLWERRDLIGNPSMGIVDAIRDKVHSLYRQLCQPDRIAVYFMEVYGARIGGAAKNYTKADKIGFRLFDVVQLEMEKFAELLSLPNDKIAGWREGGGQSFASADEIIHLAKASGFETVPPLFDMDAAQLPAELAETYEFLLSFPESRCKLDEQGFGVPEGVVVRTESRSQIAKIRREDYQRTLKRQKH
jgi:hypothetical protein